ncbi:transporter [Longibacter salinarum]|uniref:Transporter n=1 Tax=Longibacter salinarum TaxID=1850348 RepID=A0A2A8CY44_9BACT|nr:TolC family protein [Longibacter salinarum]PEN13531.1 transporter [Longibacter salinarum]
MTRLSLGSSACRLVVPLALLVILGLSSPLRAQSVTNDGAHGAHVAEGDTVQLSLAESVQRSLDVSPEVNIERAGQDFARARLGEARQNRYLTSFSANTAHSIAPSLDIPQGTTQPPSSYYLEPRVVNDWTVDALQPFNRFEVRAQQPIYTAGELGGSIRAARHGVDVEKASVDLKRLEVARRTGDIYYSLLLAEALKRLADDTGEVVDRAKREVQRLLDEGDEDVDQADLFEVRLTEEEYKRRLVEIRERLETARSALRRQLFLPDDVVIQTTDRRLNPVDFEVHPDSLAYYLALGIENRPELDKANAGIEARKALVDVERSDYFPKLGFQATYAYTYTPNRPNQRSAYINDSYNGNSTRTGIGIQMNLDFFQTRERVEQARAELNEVRYQKEAAAQLVRFEVEEAYRNVIIQKTNLESRDESLQITEEWLRNEQINFDLDFGNTENLVKAVRANLEAEARYFEAVKAYNTAVLKLLDATGTLTTDLERDIFSETE